MTQGEYPPVNTNIYKPEYPRSSQMSRPAVHWYSLMSSSVAQGSCSSPVAGSCHLMFTPLITLTAQQAPLPPHSVTPHCTQSNPPLQRVSQREVLWRALVPHGRLSLKLQCKFHSVVTAGQGSPNCEPLRNTTARDCSVGLYSFCWCLNAWSLIPQRWFYISFII